MTTPFETFIKRQREFGPRLDNDDYEIQIEMIQEMFDLITSLYAHTSCIACEENQKEWQETYNKVQQLAEKALKK